MDAYPGFQRKFFSDRYFAAKPRKRGAKRRGEKNYLWLQEHATSFPCEKSVQKLNWVTDWILLCPQGINNITMALIEYIEQLHCVGLKNRFLQRQIVTFQDNMSTKEADNFSRSFRNAVYHALSSKFENARQLKPVQEEALLQFIRRKDVFCVLPTGCGKDVNKTDRPNMTPTVRAICTFAVYFSVLRPFCRFFLVY